MRVNTEYIPSKVAVAIAEEAMMPEDRKAM